MGRREYYEEQKLKKLVYVFASVLIISVVVFLTVFVMYNKKLKESSNQSLLELGKMSEIVSNEDLEETSFSSDKSVNSSNNTIKNEVTNTASKKVNKVPVEAVVENTVVENTTTINNTNTANNNTENTNTISNETTVDKTGIINVETAKVRESANSSATIVEFLDYNDKVTIIAEDGEWYKITSPKASGYVNKRLITLAVD